MCCDRVASAISKEGVADSIQKYVKSSLVLGFYPLDHKIECDDWQDEQWLHWSHDSNGFERLKLEAYIDERYVTWEYETFNLKSR